MPAAANFSDCQVSMKNPRASPNTRGSISSTPLIGVSRNLIAPAASWLRVLLHDPHQVLAITALLEGFRELLQLLGIDEAATPSNFLHARHLQPLALLHD